MNVGSLFSGIGGLDLGLERAGMRVVWQCESDPYARAVLRKHWPDVPCYEDVRALKANLLQQVDVLAGGFPCQDVSVAGDGVGLSGERSGLWFYFARVIGWLRPGVVIIENTPPWKRWVPVVRRHLWAAGYSSLPVQLSAAQFCAQHVRARIFIVAHLDQARLPGRVQGRAHRPDAAFFEAWDRSAELDAPFVSPIDGTVEPVVGGGVHGVPSRVDRVKCLGNAVVPQVAEYIGRLILAHAQQGQ